ncbi:hypothetical protein [Citrobacter arsenatis]|uniref:hypothetical protein n=1 Tax=Citrobacter arsenatis TaxID=2546350 RepID=UPI00300E12EB
MTITRLLWRIAQVFDGLLQSVFLMMTEKEKQIALTVAQHPNISVAAIFLNANNKAIYSRVGASARKLNLQYVTEVRQFIGIEMA